jgi:hypothetical protein
MTEDRELDAWREQWSSIANATPDSERKIHRRVKQQSQRFVIGNVLSAIAFAGILLFAVVAVDVDKKWLGNRYLRFSICVCRRSHLDFARNVAPSDPDHSCLRRTLA